MKHAFQLETTDFGFETLRVVVDVARSSFVALGFGELEEFRCVGDTLGSAVNLAGVGGQASALAP